MGRACTLSMQFKREGTDGRTEKTCMVVFCSGSRDLRYHALKDLRKSYKRSSSRTKAHGLAGTGARDMEETHGSR